MRPSVRLFVLVAVNLVVRLVWLWYMHPPQVDDFEWYFTHATQMYEGQGYVWYGHATAYWPIGYPYFLSLLFHLTGPSVIMGLLANVVLSTAIVLLVYGITERIFRNTSVSFLAALGYTCLPSQIEWNSVLGSEELFTFLLLFSLWLYLGRSRRPKELSEGSHRPVWRAALSGVMMGIAADVRPIVLLFPIALLAYERWAVPVKRSSARVLWRQPILVTIVFTALMMVGVAPVTIRNFIAMHHLIIVSTNGGVNLWQGTHTNGAYFWSWDPKINPLLPYVKNDYLQNKVALHAALQFYLHHPLKGILNGFAKLFFLYWVDWNVVSVTFALKVPHVSTAVIRFNMWFDTIVYYIWMAVSITGITVSIRHYRRNYALWLLICYLVYNTAIFFFFPAWDRFRYPMMPLYAVFFGAGAWYIVRRWMRRKVT